MARRGGFGIERYETSEMQKNVKKMYERMIESDLWEVIDADKSEEKLTEELEELLVKKINQTGNESIATLW